MTIDRISESLGLDPIEGEFVESNHKDVIKAPTEAEKDLIYARDNFYTIIESGSDALQQMIDVAKASEHPRAYEVVATLIKTLTDANKDLVSMSDKTRKEEAQELKSVTNNNMFVGSTAELQQLIKNMKEEDAQN
mgnify:CR=1 FL=1